MKILKSQVQLWVHNFQVWEGAGTGKSLEPVGWAVYPSRFNERTCLQTKVEAN